MLEIKEDKRDNMSRKRSGFSGRKGRGAQKGMWCDTWKNMERKMRKGSSMDRIDKMNDIHSIRIRIWNFCF